jgi:MoaA/NifB/PqqE/SkfB family radical SAM enzyme
MTSSLRDNFCSSPWFHIRIDPQGNFLPCRWSSAIPSQHNISNTSMVDYVNSDIMRDLRLNLLDGNPVNICQACYYEDSMNKVSGRQRQLLKSTITLNNFDKTFCSTPHWDIFAHSANNQGYTEYLPIDLQIDLGNTCNSGCIMCVPKYSSRLAVDYIKLHQHNPDLFKNNIPGKNWADNQQLADKFIAELAELPNIRYIHFLGGETLYLKSFYDICERLTDLGISKNIIMGTTTNGTIYSPRLENIISSFKEVHLGISVESLHSINDYIRWPSDVDQVRTNLDAFLSLRDKTNLQVSLRITPNILSIFHLDTIFKYMLDNQVIAESCNILYDPSCLRIELLPEELIQQSLDKINKVINDYSLVPNNEVILNRRSSEFIKPVISAVIFEYKHLLENMDAPDNLESERKNLVKFLKSFEQLRENSVLSYLPEYEEFLRSHGH